MAAVRYMVLVVMLSSCGGTSADYLQSAIDATRAACTAREWEIVAESTSETQGTTELDKARDMCDRVYRALQELTEED